MNLQIIVILLFATLSVAKAEENYVLISPVANLTFEIKQDNITHLMAMLIANGYNETFNGSVNELIQVTEMRTSKLHHYQNFLQKQKLNIFDNLKDIFRVGKISPLETYKLFIKTVDSPQLKIKNAAKFLQINDQDLALVVAYDDELEFTNIIKLANATQANILNALQALDKSVDDIYEFLKPILFDRFENISMQNFLNWLQPYGTQKIIEDIFEAFNVSANNFKQGKFGNVLKNFNLTINSLEVIATAVSKNNFITVSEVYNKLGVNNSQDYLRPILKNVNNIIEVKKIAQNNLITNITSVDNLSNFIKIARNYEKNLTNCSYLTSNSSELIKEVIKKQDILVITKTHATRFVLGSPLICDNKLHGIATNYSNSTIEFQTFYKNVSYVRNNFVLNLTFEYKVEKTPQLIAFLLDNDFYATTDKNMNISELINIIKPDEMKFAQWEEIVKNLNISRKNMDGLFNFYKKFPSVDNATVHKIQKFDKFFTTLKINKTEFANLLLNQPNNQTLFKNIVKKANFTSKNVHEAFKSINFTQIVKSKVDLLSNIPMDIFLDLLRPKALEVLETTFKVVQVKPENFQVEAFKKMLEKFNDTIHTDAALAVAVSQSNFITTSNTYNKWSEQTTQQYLKVFLRNAVGTYEVNNVSLYSTGYSNITALTTTNHFVRVAGDYSKALNNCSYITLNSRESLTKVINSKENLRVLKSSGMKFVPGSPLMCNDYLYGIASKDLGKEIEFLTFYKAQELISNDHKPTKPMQTNNASHIYKSNLIYLVITYLLLSM